MEDNKKIKKESKWLSVKNEWYSHLKVSVKTLNWIIGIGIVVLVIVSVLIVLEATGTFYLFGKP